MAMPSLNARDSAFFSSFFEAFRYDFVRVRIAIEICDFHAEDIIEDILSHSWSTEDRYLKNCRHVFWFLVRLDKRAFAQLNLSALGKCSKVMSCKDLEGILPVRRAKLSGTKNFVKILCKPRRTLAALLVCWDCKLTLQSKFVRVICQWTCQLTSKNRQEYGWQNIRLGIGNDERKYDKTQLFQRRHYL